MFQKLEKCITIKVLGAPGGIAKENKITGMCSSVELKECRRPQVSFLGAVRQSVFVLQMLSSMHSSVLEARHNTKC